MKLVIIYFSFTKITIKTFIYSQKQIKVNVSELVIGEYKENELYGTYVVIK